MRDLFQKDIFNLLQNWDIMTVKLTDLLEGVYLQKDWNKVFINTKTGQIVTVLKKYFDADSEIDPDSISDRIERAQALTAKRVKDSDNFVQIPDITGDEQKQILIGFITELTGSKPDPQLSIDELKKIISSEAKTDLWYTYHLSRIKEKVMNWAFDNKIEVKNL